MNILAIPITHGLFKPNIGAQKRFFHLLKALECNNRISVLECEDFATDEEIDYNFYYYSDMKLFGRNLAILRDYNISFISNFFRLFRKEEIDLIQVTHPSGLLLIKMLMFLLGKRPILIYDAYDVQTNFISELIYHNEDYGRVERYFLMFYIYNLEKIVCKYFVDYIISVSEVERSFFISTYNLNSDRVLVIPSGGEVTDLSVYKNKNSIKSKIGLNKDAIVIFFHGAYSHSPNKEAIEIILNIISPNFLTSKNIVFLIGGYEVPVFQGPNIKSIGFIENLDEVLSIVDIAIVPIMRGTGTKIKIFDYMNASLPIITTKKGIEGIEATNYKDTIILEDLNGFEEAIRYLISNDNERERIGINARKLIKEKYDWINIGNDLNRFYNNLGVNE